MSWAIGEAISTLVEVMISTVSPVTPAAWTSCRDLVRRVRREQAETQAGPRTGRRARPLLAPTRFHAAITRAATPNRSR
jgi:hypothetical protein